MRLLKAKRSKESDNAAKFVAEFLNHLQEKGLSKESRFQIRFHLLEDATKSMAESRLMQKNLSKISFILYFSQEPPRVNMIEETYYMLRGILVDRIQDSRWPVREKATAAFCTFYKVDDPNESKPSHQPDTLIHHHLLAIPHSTHSNFLRLGNKACILRNITANGETLSVIIDRTRDTDVHVRNEAYTVLANNTTIGDEEDENLAIGLTHPRNLSLYQRNMIIRNILCDHDNPSRVSARNLLFKWAETIKVGAAQEHSKNPLENSNLVQLLSLFELRLNEHLPQGIMMLLKANTGIIQSLSSPSNHDWSLLSPAVALILRVFVYGISSLRSTLDVALPDVTDVASTLKKILSNLVKAVHAENTQAPYLDDKARALLRDKVEGIEFVAMELFKLVMYLDYSDENGRREMSELIYDILQHDHLPEALVAPSVTLLSVLERNFIPAQIPDISVYFESPKP
ncbi:hypothetical protein D9757_004206 [Collybiopsis confluens]|uniref:Uncharacterized protein n=1 Tax=Collybiopsis confluens TaxID=2823264 RepID=A0A8H5HTX3_9AGAR|nr:hypothetical protein D9757_004206 [Collybiopsis confluens]